MELTVLIDASVFCPLGAGIGINSFTKILDRYVFLLVQERIGS